MTTTQYVVAQHNLNRADLVIKVTRQAWMDAAVQQDLPKVHICIQCGYTGGFTHLYEGAYPECPMCKGE
jgi:rubrerythrin